MAYKIAAIPGDGIGDEVVNAAIPFLRTVADGHGFDLDVTHFDWSSGRYLETGEVMPNDGIERLRSFDAILHGATGHPEVPEPVGAWELVIRIRRAFDLYVNERPVYLFNEELSPLKGYGRGDIDIHWFRENSEGEYADIGGTLGRADVENIAVQTSVYTRDGVERIVRAAFEHAVANDRDRLTSVTKINAQRFSSGLWDTIAEDVSEEYPDIEFESMLVDAMAQHLVKTPDRFEVVVASNLFSDIHTDLTASIVGGLGLAPSANLNPARIGPAMFEPVHGSAPDIAGRNIANPIAAILSGKLMFEYLGEHAAAASVWNAVDAVLNDPSAPRTPDLGGTASTDDVIEALRSHT